MKSFQPTVTQFKSNGTDYYVHIGGFGFERMKKFHEYMINIRSGKSIYDLLEFIKELQSDVSNIKINGSLKQFSAIDQKLNNLLKHTDLYGPETMIAESMEAVYDLCALFVIREGEDMSQIDDVLFEKKKADWKKDHDFDSFFLLGTQRLPLYVRKSIAESLQKEQIQ